MFSFRNQKGRKGREDIGKLEEEVGSCTDLGLIIKQPYYLGRGADSVSVQMEGNKTKSVSTEEHTPL